MSKDPGDWLMVKRVVRFGETDAAGVMHFHNLFRWCHEAWEESLQRYGINVNDIFPNGIEKDENLEIALPIVHCQADFRLPIFTGNHLDLILSPEKIDMWSFQVKTKFKREGENVASGLIRHVSINAKNRQRCTLPSHISLWLEASSINLGPRPL